MMESADMDTILRAHPLFSDLTDDQLKKVCQISKIIHLQPDDYLVREGDTSKDFYIIVEGEVEIFKKGKTFAEHYFITRLGKNESIGEVALFDQGPRSASVKAIRPSKILSIPFNLLYLLGEEDAAFNKIVFKISKNLGARLRHANEITVQAFEKHLNEYKLRVSMSVFMVNVIIALCAFTFVLSVLHYFQESPLHTSIITVPLTVIFLLLIYLVIKYSHLPLQAFGLTTRNWKRSVLEAMGTAFIGMLVILMVKFVMVHVFDNFRGQPIFQPFKYAHVSENFAFSRNAIWWLTLVIYVFLTSPLQELIARGGLQSSLESFLSGKHRALKAILISNLMFSTAHLFISITVAILVFVAGLYFGWLYSRTRTLIGVTLAHAILGAWAFHIVGI